MTRVWTRSIAAAAIALGVMAGLAMPAAAQEQCLDRREIQQKINSGEVAQVSEAMARAGVDGKLISSTVELCQIGGGLQWRVSVMDAAGESQVVTLPAQ
jgi:hypothetical protein